MSNLDRDPGTITDGQVLSARLKANDLGWFGRFDAPAEEWRQVLTAALTEPPSRPEWADLADVIRETTYHPEPDDLARALHPEGVRVVTEEENR